MDNEYSSKRRLGTTLLPWQQKFCDNKMYFMLDLVFYVEPSICKISIKSDLYRMRKLMRNRSFNFSQNWRSDHMTSQILLEAQVFVPQITLIWPSLNLYNSGTRRDIEKR